MRIFRCLQVPGPHILPARQKRSVNSYRHKVISIPPVYFLACVVVTGLLRFLVPGMNRIHFPLTLGGGLFLGAGTCLIAWSHRSLTRRATAVTFAPSTCLIQDGLYQHSRNPMYAGFVAFQIGLAILSGNVLALLCPVALFCVLNWMFIPYEEEKMEGSFGRQYLDYKQKVRRWL